MDARTHTKAAGPEGGKKIQDSSGVFHAKDT